MEVNGYNCGLELKVVIWKPSSFSLCSVFLQGYEHYKTMRADPSLCFLSRVGLPNNMNESMTGEPTDPDDRWVHSDLKPVAEL